MIYVLPDNVSTQIQIWRRSKNSISWHDRYLDNVKRETAKWTSSWKFNRWCYERTQSLTAIIGSKRAKIIQILSARLLSSSSVSLWTIWVTLCISDADKWELPPKRWRCSQSRSNYCRWIVFNIIRNKITFKPVMMMINCKVKATISIVFVADKKTVYT